MAKSGTCLLYPINPKSVRSDKSKTDPRIAGDVADKYHSTVRPLTV